MPEKRSSSEEATGGSNRKENANKTVEYERRKKLLDEEINRVTKSVNVAIENGIVIFEIPKNVKDGVVKGEIEKK